MWRDRELTPHTRPYFPQLSPSCPATSCLEPGIQTPAFLAGRSTLDLIRARAMTVGFTLFATWRVRPKKMSDCASTLYPDLALAPNPWLISRRAFFACNCPIYPLHQKMFHGKLFGPVGPLKLTKLMGDCSCQNTSPC